MRFASLDAPQSLVDYKNIDPQLFTEAIAGHDKDTNAVLDTTANAYNQILQDGTLDPDTKQQRLAVVRDNIANLYKQHDGNIGMARPAIMDYFQKEYSDPYWQADKQMFDKHKALMDETNKLRSQGESVIYRDQNGQIVDNPAGFYKPYDEFGNLRNPAEVNLSPEKVINGYEIADKLFANIPLDTTDSFGEGSGSIEGYIEEKKKGTNVPKINHFMDKALQAFVANGGQQYLELNGEKKTRELLDAMAEKHKQTTVDNSLVYNQYDADLRNQQQALELQREKEKKEKEEKYKNMHKPQYQNNLSYISSDGKTIETPISEKPKRNIADPNLATEFDTEFPKLTNKYTPAQKQIFMSDYLYQKDNNQNKNTILGQNSTENKDVSINLGNRVGSEYKKTAQGETIINAAPILTEYGELWIPKGKSKDHTVIHQGSSKLTPEMNSLTGFWKNINALEKGKIRDAGTGEHRAKLGDLNIQGVKIKDATLSRDIIDINEVPTMVLTLHGNKGHGDYTVLQMSSDDMKDVVYDQLMESLIGQKKK